MTGGFGYDRGRGLGMTGGRFGHKGGFGYDRMGHLSLAWPHKMRHYTFRRYFFTRTHRSLIEPGLQIYRCLSISGHQSSLNA